MTLINPWVLVQQAELLTRGGPDAEGAARFILRASLCEREARDAALRAGAVTAILPYLRPNTHPHLLVLLTRSFSNFCRHAESEPPVDLELVSPALPLIKGLLDCEDQHVLEAACAAVRNISQGGDECARAVCAVDGLMERLEALLAHETRSVRHAAILALGNILPADNTQMESEVGSLASALEGAPEVARGAARAVANKMADPAAIQPALDAGVLPLLCKLLLQGDTECRDEAVRALVNLCYFGSAEQRLCVANLEVLVSYYEALAAAEGAPPALQLLSGLNALLQGAEMEDNKFHSKLRSSERVLCDNLNVLTVFELTERLLKFNDKEVQRQALQLQTAVAFYVQGENIVYEDGKVFAVADVAEGLKLPQPARRTRAARAARRLLTRASNDDLFHILDPRLQSPPIDRLKRLTALMLSHSVPQLLIADLDTDDCPDLQCEAAGAVRMLFVNVHHSIYEVTAIPKLAALGVKGGEMATHAAYALGSIVSDSNKNAILESGALSTLLPHLAGAPSELKRACIHVYHMLSECIEPQDVKLFAPALPSLLDLLTGEDKYIQEDSWKVFRNLISTEAGHEGREEALAVPGLLARLVGLLGRLGELLGRGDTLGGHALNAVADLLAGNHAQKEQCLKAGCLEHIIRVFEMRRKMTNCSYKADNCLEAAARAAAGLWSGTAAQAQRALDEGLLDHLLDILTEKKYSLKSKLYAVEATSRLCRGGSGAQRDLLVASGALQAWAAVLRESSEGVGLTLGTYYPESKNHIILGLDALLKAAHEGGCDVEGLRSRLQELGLRDLIAGAVWSCDDASEEIIDPRDFWEKYEDLL